MERGWERKGEGEGRERDGGRDVCVREREREGRRGGREGKRNRQWDTQNCSCIHVDTFIASACVEMRLP